MIGSWNLRDVRPEAIVSSAEPELVGTPAELDVRTDLGDLIPRNPHAAASSDPGSDAPDQSAPGSPDTGTAEDCGQFQVCAGGALEREVVDFPAAPAVAVEQLVIEDVQPHVDRVGQF